MGREELLKKLQTMLFTTQGFQKVALVGLGGVGKTQTALQLAFWVKQFKQEYSVFWVPALSFASFGQAYTQIMKLCAIRGAEDEDPKELVRQYLNSEKSGKWLLVVDNADDMEIVRGSRDVGNDIYRFLPTSDQGRILFTTRFRKVAVSVATSSVLEIDEMSQKEAKCYLEKSLIQKDLLDDQQAVEDLLEVLTCLPLALTQAAAYLNENQITVVEYVQLFKGTDRDMVELLSSEFHDDTRYPQTQDAVATTWFISFRQIRKVDQLAEDLLLFIACVEPKDIAQSMLPEGESQQQLTRAIGTLCGYGFLTRREDRETFDMHRLVHVATQIWAQSEDLVEETRHKAIAHLAEVFPEDEWENRDVDRKSVV